METSSKNEKLCHGPVTKRDVEKALQKYFNTCAKLTSVHDVVISQGHGFTADIIKVHLEWDTKNDLPLSVIVKAPNVENASKLLEIFGDQAASVQGLKFVTTVHEMECRAYRYLGAAPPLPVPKVYGYNLITESDHGYLIMEDMTQKAGLVENVANGITLNQWRNCLDCLADLHSWSLTTDVPWGKELTSITSLSEFYQPLCDSTAEKVKLIKNSYPEYFSHVNEEQLINEMKVDKIMAVHTKHKKVMPDVFQHGDTWINNILFQKNDNGELTDTVAAFIDWQICMKGSFANDVARLSSWCLNHQLRRAHEMELLRHYYQRLISKSCGKIDATFDQIKDLYQSVAALNGLMGVVTVDLVLNIAKVDEDKTGWRKREMLERARALYDDAAKIYGW